MGRRDHGRVDPDRDLIPAGRLDHGQQFDDVPEPAGEGDVVGRDVGDPLAVDVAGDHPDAERHAGQDGRLGRRVVALDVRRRVTLGVAEVLGLGQGVVVGGAGLGHHGQDVVGRPVDDAHDAADLLPGQRLPQWPDQGDPAAYRGLEQQVDAAGGRRFEQLGAHVGQQFLVGGDDRLAGLQSLEDQAPGRLDAADDLDDHVDVGIADHGVGIGRQQAHRDRGRPLPGQAAHRHRGQFEPQAGAGLDGGRILDQELGQGSADVAAAEEADADGGSFHGRRGYRKRRRPDPFVS